MEIEDIKKQAQSIVGKILFDHSIKNLNWFKSTLFPVPIFPVIAIFFKRINL